MTLKSERHTPRHWRRDIVHETTKRPTNEHGKGDDTMGSKAVLAKDMSESMLRRLSFSKGVVS
ncbi:MAG: hypothetical protein KAQ74_06545, partial [Dehalococcoidia bacterium]|nr:hypothetical protein [Dehalococcoidia bacterium]